VIIDEITSHMYERVVGKRTYEMGIWDDFNLTSGIEKPRRTRTVDKAQTWIKKFSEYLAEQKTLLKTIDQKADSQKKTRGKRNKSHIFWSEDRKVFVFEPRYGTKQVNLQPGKNQITSTTADEMQGKIDKLIQITKNGELNAALEEAASRKKETVADPESSAPASTAHKPKARS
jgi:hypothetical protein